MGLLGTSWDDPQTLAVMQLAGGLLSGGNFGQALGKGLVGYTAQLNQAGDRKLQEAQMEQARAKAEEYQRQVAASKATGQRDALFQDAVSRGATPQQLAQYFPDKVDLIKKLADAPNFGRQAVARTIEVEGPNGMKMIRQADQYGNPVGEDVAGYTPPQLINQGDKQTFAKPVVGQTFAIGMSPAERDASARGWASNGIAQQRLAIEKQNAGGGEKAPAGYRWKPDGTMEAIPGGPADNKVGAPGAKIQDAKDVLGILDMVDPLLKKSTGSYAGAAIDSGAQLFGISTDGAKAAAELKALQGALISKMPKMTGPQSDKDVQLYREMAGQIGDPTIPVETRQAAAKTVRMLNEKYANGMQTDGQPAKAPVMNAKPVANSSNKGRVIHETDANGQPTGKTFKSNGLQWVEQ